MTDINEVSTAYEQLLAARTEATVRTVAARTEADLAEQHDDQAHQDVNKAIRARAEAGARTRQARRRYKHAKGPEQTTRLAEELRVARLAEEAAQAAYKEAAGRGLSARAFWKPIGRLVRAGFWPSLAVAAAFAVYAVAALAWKPSEEPDPLDDDRVMAHQLRRAAVGAGAIVGVGFIPLVVVALATDGIAVVVGFFVLAVIVGFCVRAWVHACERHEHAILTSWTTETDD
ncbi:hypothetical protein ACFV2B_07470 [Streptomyces lavendulae]|uniref:hypothetical protein n=1 Tax=Streptomyces lavendulae TaxID=1914 RepID=UPI0036A140A5